MRDVVVEVDEDLLGLKTIAQHSFGGVRIADQLGHAFVHDGYVTLWPVSSLRATDTVDRIYHQGSVAS